jgi:hypothetical protein
MADGPLRRGAKTLSERDWVFGSRPRRRLLEGVLIGKTPKDGWTRPELARIAGVIANGGVDEHLAGLHRLGLITANPVVSGTWLPVRPHGPLAIGVRKVLGALQATSDRPAPSTSRPRIVTRAAAIKTVATAEQVVKDAARHLDQDAVTEVLALLEKARRRLEC